MPTQRLVEKRVEECTGEGERERERERERESEPFDSSFYVFFFPLGLPYANWA